MSALDWAAEIRASSQTGRVNTVVAAVNVVVGERRATQADVMTACAAMLGQIIVGAAPDSAADARAGILALIDSFAMQAACHE